jgi:ABC-type polysaccharide/polyol phosphate export permease
MVRVKCYTRGAVIANLRVLWRYRDLLRGLVQRDLRIKYKGSVLGIGWSLAHPLVVAAVYTLAFKYILRVPVENFALYLLSGMLPWTAFTASLAQSTSSIVDNVGLVRKVAFPRMVLPLAAIGSHFTQFAFMYTALLAAALVVGPGPRASLLAVPAVAALQLAFTAGLGLVLATLHVHFRDTRHLLDVAVQVWFWVTPIVYTVSLIPERFRPLVYVNPMAAFVEAYHAAVVAGQWPGVPLLGLLAVLAAASLSLGMLVFSGAEKRFAERV